MPFIKPKKRNTKLDESFIQWMRKERDNFSKATGIPISSDVKFSALIVQGNLVKIRLPKKRGGINVKFF